SAAIASPVSRARKRGLVSSASGSTPLAARRSPSARACSRPAALSRRNSSGLPGSASAWRMRISRTNDEGALGAVGRGELAPRLADVLGGRADDLVVGVLLEHVRRPARDAAGGEQRREEVGRDAEVAVDGGRPEVDVRVQALFLKDRLLCGQRDLVPVRLAGVVRELLGDRLQDQGARIVGAVERMPEAGELLLA